MAEYCKCGLLLITDKERRSGICRLCDYARKYAELIKFNSWHDRRVNHYIGAGFAAALAVLYRLLY